jgi:phosphotransferase system  glucose/maltose/N-acetylglucosamine-specific IIC component
MGADPYTAGQLAGQAAVGQPVHATTPYLGAYQDLMAQVRTETYANGFYVVAVMSLIAAGIAVFMRSGRKKDTGGPAHVVEL